MPPPGTFFARPYARESARFHRNALHDCAADG
jgi:hypothetical protein